ncbi:MAG TPA: amidohydrolase, partial [Candidatus Limnocylindria bacterium]|nr:amidohydrolase [Candidatus Limnocylindria bacterium]
ENGRPNGVLAKLARANAEKAGLRLDEPPKGPPRGGASSDFGNVSQVLPATAISFAVSEKPIPGHSILMREAAITDLANRNAIAVAKTLALVATDLLADPAKVAEARASFATWEEKKS